MTALPSHAVGYYTDTILYNSKIFKWKCAQLCFCKIDVNKSTNAPLADTSFNEFLHIRNIFANENERRLLSGL